MSFTGPNGGACDAIPVQPFEVLGKTNSDQSWIDETEASAQGACPGRPKPGPRPANLDKPTKAPPPVAQKPAKRHFWQRVRKPAVAGFVNPIRLPPHRPVVAAQPAPAPAVTAARPAPIEPAAAPEIEQGDAPTPEHVKHDGSPAPPKAHDELDDLLGTAPSAPSSGTIPKAQRKSWCLWYC